MSRAKPTAVELFCGVGGMSLGFQDAGFDLSAAVDWDQRAVEYHRLNFPGCRTLQGDLSKLSGKQIRALAGLGDKKIDVVFGGPPCQGFSLIGRRDVADHRNELLYHFIRLVKQLQPDYFVMENVHGLTVGAARSMLQTFERKARRAGFDVVTPIQSLDASEFGVPQRRKRVIVIGHRRGTVAPTYPLPLPQKAPTVGQAISDLPDIELFEHLFESDVYEGKLGPPSTYAKALRIVAKGERAIRLSGCLRTRHSAKTTERFSATPVGKTEPTSRFHRLDPSSLAFTIRAGTGPDFGSHTAARPIHPHLPRCITVREAARLHSFPDWFCFHPTKWHGFRQIGNSVPPLLAKHVAKQLNSAITQTARKRSCA